MKKIILSLITLLNLNFAIASETLSEVSFNNNKIKVIVTNNELESSFSTKVIGFESDILLCNGFNCIIRNLRNENGSLIGDLQLYSSKNKLIKSVKVADLYDDGLNKIVVKNQLEIKNKNNKTILVLKLN